MRTDPQGGGYELVIEPPDSAVRIECFTEPGSLNQRWATLERSLVREGWWGPCGRDR